MISVYTGPLRPSTESKADNGPHKDPLSKERLGHYRQATEIEKRRLRSGNIRVPEPNRRR